MKYLLSSEMEAEYENSIFGKREFRSGYRF